MEYQVIKIGIGLGDIIFGMGQEEVIGILGEPDSTENMEFLEDDTRKILKYHDKGFQFGFDSVNAFKLASIDIEDSRYMFGFARAIINSPLADILESLELKEFGTPTIESIGNENEPNHLMLFYDDVGLFISLIDYVCDSFSIEPLWKNENEIIWPEKP